MSGRQAHGIGVIGYAPKPEGSGVADQHAQDAPTGWKRPNCLYFVGGETAGDEVGQFVAGFLQNPQSGVPSAHRLSGRIDDLLQDAVEFVLGRDADRCFAEVPNSAPESLFFRYLLLFHTPSKVVARWVVSNPGAERCHRFGAWRTLWWP